MATQLHRMLPLNLYMLKRQHGGPVDIYKLTTSTTDVKTGVKTQTKTVYHVDRAVILPAGYLRTRSPSIISNSQFVAGGSRDTSLRDFIVDRKDVPLLLTLTVDDWIVYNNKKYQITKSDGPEYDSCYYITAKELVGEVPEQVFNIQVEGHMEVVSETEVA